MKYYVYEDEIALKHGAGHESAKLLDERHGAVNQYAIGISFYSATEYGTPGLHTYQEGFYVVEGWGHAKIHNEEFAIKPGTAFIAPEGAEHTLRRAADSPPIKVVWTHAAV